MSQTLLIVRPQDVNVDDDFTIIYNSNPVKTSRYKFALFSSRFRSSPEYFSSDSMVVTDTVPYPTFSDFIQATLGKPISINNENLLDLIHLSLSWGCSGLESEIKRFINDTARYESLISSISQSQMLLDSDLIIESIAQRIEAAITVSSFASFPLSTIQKILSHPKLCIHNYHLLHHFVVSLLTKYGKAASPLVKCIDLRQLTAEEISSLLDNPIVSPKDVSETSVPLCLSLSKQTVSLQEQISSILKRLESLEEVSIVEEIDRIDSNFTLLEDRIDALCKKTVKTSHEAGKSSDFDSLKQAVEKMESKQKQLATNSRAELSALSTKLNSIDKAVVGLKEKMAEISGKAAAKVTTKVHDGTKVATSSTKVAKLKPTTAKRHVHSENSKEGVTEELVEDVTTTEAQKPADESIRAKVEAEKVDLTTESTETSKDEIEKAEAAAVIEEKPVAEIKAADANKDEKIKQPEDTPKVVPDVNWAQDPVKFATSADPLEGVFSALTRKYNGNLAEKQIINVSASSSLENGPESLINPQTEGLWISKNSPNQWVSFEFLSYLIVPTDYSIRTISFPQNSCHPLVWTVEGSSDANNWIELDARSTQDLNNSGKIEVFHIQRPSDTKLKIIRIRQTGSSARGDNVFALSSVELFGSLFSDQSKQ